MGLKIYSYKNCSTCKKALKFVEELGISASVIDITSTPPTKAELRTMLKHYQGDVRKLFNTSGQVYREMGLASKLAAMSESEAIDLLSHHGKLVKRPFALTESKAGAVGFREEEWRSLLR